MREYERKQNGDKRIGKIDQRVRYTCGQLFVDGKRISKFH